MNVTNEKALALKEESRQAQAVVREDEFLSVADLVPVKKQAAQRSLRRTLGEMAELVAEKKWEELIEIFYPVDEKVPELVEYDLDAEVRAKTGFALGQVKRFDEAIRELEICVEKDPVNFHFCSSLAYNAYNMLYAARNREVFLSGKVRADRIQLAHKHFKRSQELRPDGVTNFYREGMLFRQIEDKPFKALPLFRKAVSNWDSLDKEEKEARHQERKNYVKSLYQLAGCLLGNNRPDKALSFIKRCLSEDEKTSYYSLVYKYFALGKVHFHMNAFSEAKDALLFALQCRSNQPVDFVYELLARTYLAMGKPRRAMDVVNKVPEKKRRPYYRWTEADVLCALKDYEGAREVLKKCGERDRRSRHKALIRLSKLEYLLGNFQESMGHAAEAVRFFNETWGGFFSEGIFWESLSAYRAGEVDRARELAGALKSHQPGYPGLSRLLDKLFPADRKEN